MIAAPNESHIEGTLVSHSPAGAAGGTVWEVDLHVARPSPGLPNAAGRHVGKRIRVHVHPGCKFQPEVGRRIAATITFQGDERGGAFFLKGEDVRHDPS